MDTPTPSTTSRYPTTPLPNHFSFTRPLPPSCQKCAFPSWPTNPDSTPLTELPTQSSQNGPLYLGENGLDKRNKDVRFSEIFRRRDVAMGKGNVMEEPTDGLNVGSWNDLNWELEHFGEEWNGEVKLTFSDTDDDDERSDDDHDRGRDDDKAPLVWRFDEEIGRSPKHFLPSFSYLRQPLKATIPLAPTPATSPTYHTLPMAVPRVAGLKQEEKKANMPRRSVLATISRSVVGLREGGKDKSDLFTEAFKAVMGGNKAKKVRFAEGT